MKNVYNTDLISVIIPVYNVQEYLDHCVTSVQNQTYQNIEIVLVDDGSTDGCGEMCEQYTKRDNRILVIHKENGGLSDARNEGMKKAHGQYITFVDSDDMIDRKFIEKLYVALKKSGSDIAFCNYIETNENIIKVECQETGTLHTYSNIECLKNLYQPKEHGMTFVTWGKLYDIRLFRDYGIQFPYGKIHEDTFVTYQIVYYAKCITFLNLPLYYYRIRPNSIMHSSSPSQHLHGIEATRSACRFFFKNNEREVFAYAVNAHFHAYIRILLKMHDILDKDRYSSVKKQMLQEYRIDVKIYLLHAKLGLKKTVFYFLFGLFPLEPVAKKITGQ